MEVSHLKFSQYSIFKTKLLDYSDTKIVRLLNAELADTMGNLLSRACAKTLNPRQQFPQVDLEQLNELIKTDTCKILFERLTELHEKCRLHYSDYNFHLVVDNVISTLHASNAFFEFTKPWELKKSDEDWKIKRLDSILSIALESLRISGVILQPIIPNYSCRLLDRLNVPADLRFWKDAKINLKKVPADLVDLDSNILFKKIITESENQTNNKKLKN